MLNYTVLGLSFLFEGAAWFFALRQFKVSKGRRGYLQDVRRSKDPSTFVVLFEDTAAMAGILVAFLGIWVGQVAGVRHLAGEVKEVDHVNEILTLHMGPEYVLVNMSLDFDDTCTAEEVELAVARLNERIKLNWPLVKKVFVEAERQKEK